MKKRAGFAYGLSVALAAAAFTLLMLRLLGPSTRWAAASIYAGSWVSLVYAVRRHLRVRRQVRNSATRFKQFWSEWHQEVIASLALGIFGALGLILLPANDPTLFLESKPALQRRLERDQVRVTRALAGLRTARLEATQAFEEKNPTGPEDSLALRQAWATYLDYAVELDQLLDVHEHFFQINSVTMREERARSFLIAFTALSAQVNNGLLLRKAVPNGSGLERLLNESSPNGGLAAGTYFHFTQGLTRADTLVRLQAGAAYYTALLAQGLFRRAPLSALADTAKHNALGALRLLGKSWDSLVDTPLDYFERKAFAAWFPLQRNVASELGDLRTQHRPNFVNRELLADLEPRLAPMDIFLERRNWYITNIGLPGFWPHAALYVGSLEQLDAYFDEASRAATEGRAPSAFLRERFPKVHAALQQTDTEGDPFRVLEAISEGVVFQSLEHSGGADYLAVLRPKLNKTEKLRALLRAFGHHEKPYDFDFDFATDNTLVCSELVYKSLESIGKIHFELQPSSGRMVLTPNQIAQKFDVEYDVADPQLEFVAFLDGSEQLGTAHPADATALRGSWRRPKWDIAQP